MVVQENGKILIAGEIAAVNGVATTSNLIRLNADLTLDDSFNSMVMVVSRNFRELLRMSLQEDQKILLYTEGAQLFVNGNQIDKGIRLNTDGSVDESFALESNFEIGPAPSLTALKDGEVLVVGTIRQDPSDVDSFRDDALLVLNSNGSSDRTFWLTDRLITRVIVQDFDSIWVNGSGSEVRMQKHSADGTPVPGFEITPRFLDSNLSPSVGVIQEIPNGGLFVAGGFEVLNNTKIRNYAILREERLQCFPIKTQVDTAVQICM